ncbi:hypothetical protein MNEG_12669 [Monoraphidium neglectum]|uniref:Cytochrome P450 n=1 Tax=Monoraphidium neglectum TaxID=145388 RepID=A0A0D2KHK6_9CHLO|nr:hypothetical protein MNEG_12669 [Monoraphidium neglectum]KIY95293.1 hypothetical protein MNEG_12669 [Monoraphidium neglectum]|eukprot:XP_013894313.1 hypothetical protein MNEG_12669 [Monoraphidium neglectum]
MNAFAGHPAAPTRAQARDAPAAGPPPAAGAPGAPPGRCPVLAALPPPPTAAVPWYRRLMQFRDPLNFQATLLSSADVVTTPAQIGFPEMVVPGTAEFAKAVLAREGDLTEVAPFLVLGDLVGEGTMGLMQEPGHREFRNLLAPAFTYEAINGRFLPEIAAIVGRTLERWEGAGAPVKAYDAFKRMTFEIIMNVMMGKEYAAAEIDRLHEMFTTYTGGMAQFPQWDVPFLKYGKAMQVGGSFPWGSSPWGDLDDVAPAPGTF